MKSSEFAIRAGFVCCLLAGLGQFATDYWLVRHYPGYRWMAESVSYLGQVDSPVKREVAIWGVVFAVLMAMFGWGFYRAFASEGRWATFATGMILLYALGEGAGSGLLPVDPGRGLNAPSHLLHNLFSICGDAGSASPKSDPDPRQFALTAAKLRAPSSKMTATQTPQRAQRRNCAVSEPCR